jgi:hypothetical protein
MVDPLPFDVRELHFSGMQDQLFESIADAFVHVREEVCHFMQQAFERNSLDV